MKKVYVLVTCRLIVNLDEEESFDELMENMDYNFTSHTDGADIVDTEIREWQVVDGK